MICPNPLTLQKAGDSSLSSWNSPSLTKSLLGLTTAFPEFAFSKTLSLYL